MLMGVKVSSSINSAVVNADFLVSIARKLTIPLPAIFMFSDSFWGGQWVVRDPAPFLGRPIPSIQPPIPAIPGSDSAYLLIYLLPNLLVPLFINCGLYCKNKKITKAVMWVARYRSSVLFSTSCCFDTCEASRACLPTTLHALSTGDVPLKPLSSSGAVRHDVPAPDHPTPLLPEPPTDGGPLVPLDGPRSSSEKGSPIAEPEPEPGAAALAVVVSNYQFSQPELRWVKCREERTLRAECFRHCFSNVRIGLVH